MHAQNNHLPVEMKHAYERIKKKKHACLKD